jgi:hypothetical protein
VVVTAVSGEDQGRIELYFIWHTAATFIANGNYFSGITPNLLNIIEGFRLVINFSNTDKTNKKYHLDTNCSFSWHRSLRRSVNL